MAAALLECAAETEIEHRRGRPLHARGTEEQPRLGYRNGYRRRTLQFQSGSIPIRLPRVRNETASAWHGFLQRLIVRGLDRQALELVISDEHKGLMDAVEQLLGDVDHQLCWAHRMRNVREAVRPSDRSCVVEMLRNVYRADTLSHADRALTDLERTWRDRYPGVIQSLREDARHLFAFFNAPVEHREYVRITNPIERTFRAVRRWRRGCGAFADAQACGRVFYKVSMLLNERWRTKDLWDLPKRRDQAEKAHLQAQPAPEDDAATQVRMPIDPRLFDMP